ncbi:MAG: hypothetical protein ACI9Y1_000424 [Lentisphaeria bacterium]|jgi:hypothetical protein
MRALALFIMRGRFQAVIIALIGSWVPLLSQAALGMVTLRKGWQEGLLLSLWALLPLLAGLWIGDVGFVLVYATSAVLFVTYALALVLRATVSWSHTLFLAVVLSIFSVLVINFFVADLSEELTGVYRTIIKDMASSGVEGGAGSAQGFGGFTSIETSSLIAFWIGITSIAGVLLARWFQALAYNPGGFQREFHDLRLNVPLAVVSLLAFLFCTFKGNDYRLWAHLLGFPLALAGLGLVHFVVVRLKWGVTPLVLMYVALIIFSPLAVVLIVAAFSDVWLDYRQKFIKQ